MELNVGTAFVGYQGRSDDQAIKDGGLGLPISALSISCDTVCAERFQE